MTFESDPEIRKKAYKAFHRGLAETARGQHPDWEVDMERREGAMLAAGIMIAATEYILDAAERTGLSDFRLEVTMSENTCGHVGGYVAAMLSLNEDFADIVYSKVQACATCSNKQQFVASVIDTLVIIAVRMHKFAISQSELN